MNEKRIYIVVAGTIQVPSTPSDSLLPLGSKTPLRTVVQPAGRQIAQACHAVSRLRYVLKKNLGDAIFNDTTTIVLQSRDSAETEHVFKLLMKKKALIPVLFYDENPEYGPGRYLTAIAVYATKKEVNFILDYLPLWK